MTQRIESGRAVIVKTSLGRKSYFILHRSKIILIFLYKKSKLELTKKNRYPNIKTARISDTM